MVNNALTGISDVADGRESAEFVAITALGWLANDADLLRTFCGATGLTASDLQAAGETPETLVGVLDFLCLDDIWIIAFSDATGIPPEAPARARALLAGGDAPHWT